MEKKEAKVKHGKVNPIKVTEVQVSIGQKNPHRLSCVWILNCDFKKFTSGRNTLESVKAHRIFLERSYRLNAN